MSKLSETEILKLANAKAKGKRPYFFEDPAVERVLNITLALAGELAVARERMDTIERILEKKGILTRQEIETYLPDSSEIEEQRQRWHAEYIARVLRIVQQEIEAIQDPESNKSMQEIAQLLSKS